MLASDPQVIENQPFEAYLKHHSLSRSVLWHMRASPWHYHQALLNPDEEVTEAMLMGGALHARVLEPEDFDRRYWVCPLPPRPEGDGRTKAVKDARAAWDADMAAFQETVPSHATVLTEQQFERVESMATGLRALPQFHAAMATDPRIETTILWDDVGTELALKARLDIWTRDSNVVLDVKTSSDASPAAFARSCARYGYHLQDAMYTAAVTEATGNDPGPVVFLVV
ncbi:MAG: PD-(D/E)XK nuclease-like domain-containing protein, partial [Hyphomicrobiales bacterium]